MNTTPVNHRAMSDGHIIPYYSRSCLIHYVDAHIILDIASISNSNGIHISTYGGIKPYTGLITNTNIPDDIGTLGDKCRWRNLWATP